MKRRQFVSDIRRSACFFEEMELLGTFSTPSSLDISEETRRLVLDPQVTYEAIYLNALRRVEYNFILNEYSMFQFNYRESGDIRYAYLPNPFLQKGMDSLASFREMMDAGILSFEEYSQLISEKEFSYHVPVIRYECCLDQYRGRCSHPASHIHIGTHTSNRWYVERVLTPLMFSMAVAKMYYKEVWDASGTMAVEREDYGNKFDEAMAKEKMNCRLLPGKFFSLAERRHMYWA